jgi:uncharacterized protein YlxP (DUF503 family)
MLFHDV